MTRVDDGPRYSNEDAQKISGATYTPFGFATFVAQQMLQVADLPARGTIRILDPAVGDGALLDALIKCLPAAARERVEVWGYDTDFEAIRIASARIAEDFPGLPVQLVSEPSEY